MSRALSMLVRAVVEAALPRITRAYHAGDRARLRQLLARSLGAGLVFAVLLSSLLLGVGDWLFATLFDGRATIDRTELALIVAALAALTIICVSVYVQGALGRFSTLLHRSLPFLAGSLASAPLALALTPQGFDLTFLGLYTLTLAGAAILHLISLQRLARA